MSKHVRVHERMCKTRLGIFCYCNHSRQSSLRSNYSLLLFRPFHRSKSQDVLFFFCCFRSKVVKCTIVDVLPIVVWFGFILSEWGATSENRVISRDLTKWRKEEENTTDKLPAHVFVRHEEFVLLSFSYRLPFYWCYWRSPFHSRSGLLDSVCKVIIE